MFIEIPNGEIINLDNIVSIRLMPGSFDGYDAALFARRNIEHDTLEEGLYLFKGTVEECEEIRKHIVALLKPVRIADSHGTKSSHGTKRK